MLKLVNHNRAHLHRNVLKVQWPLKTAFKFQFKQGLFTMLRLANHNQFTDRIEILKLQ